MRLSLADRVVSMLMRTKLPEDMNTLEEVAGILGDLRKLGDSPDVGRIKEIQRKLEPREV